MTRFLPGAAAVVAGKRLIDAAQPERGGLKWAVAPNVKNQYPNFSHGAAGVSDDFPLAAAWAHARTIRIADGPDEVHREAIAKLELRKYAHGSTG